VAGTELFNGVSIAANSYFDWYGNLKMLSTDFLVGGSNTATAPDRPPDAAKGRLRWRPQSHRYLSTQIIITPRFAQSGMNNCIE
jgi:hypothetical protein